MKHSHLLSLGYKVNGWGFQRVLHGNDHNSYKHDVRYGSSTIGAAEQTEKKLKTHPLFLYFLSCLSKISQNYVKR